MEIKAPVDLQLQALLAQPDQLVVQGHRVTKGQPDLNWDWQDQVDYYGSRVHQDIQVLQGPLGSLDHQDFRDLLDSLVSF